MHRTIYYKLYATCDALRDVVSFEMSFCPEGRAIARARARANTRLNQSTRTKIPTFK